MMKSILKSLLLGGALLGAAPTLAEPTSETRYPMDFKAGPVAQQLQKVDRGTASGPFRPNWESLKAIRTPEWFRDAKFGIFLHWGPYAVPGFLTEWYSRNMYDPGNVAFTYHRNVFGPQSRFGYKDFIPKFTAEKFDAAQWIALFQDAGARYVMPVAEHCDGFAMYDSQMTDWNEVKMGPKQDTAAALMKAARAKGLHFGLSSHRAEHWWWYDAGRGYDSDVNDPRYAGLYGPAAPMRLPGDATPGTAMPNGAHLENWSVPNKQFLDDWLARTTEFIDKYDPEIVYLDWWTSAPAFEPYLQRMAAYYYNSARKKGYSPSIAYKGAQFAPGTALFDVERGKLDELRLEPWQTDTSISTKSWGYIQDDEYKTPKALVQDLVDIVSKNGNLMLNVGPRADGTIPEGAQAVLRGIGAWMKINGEAIYGSRPWKYFGEGPTVTVAGEKNEAANRGWKAEDIRYTTKGDALYAIAMERPADGVVRMKTLYAGSPYLNRKIGGISLLGSGPVAWQQTDKGLEASLPASATGDMPYVLRIGFAS